MLLLCLGRRLRWQFHGSEPRSGPNARSTGCRSTRCRSTRCRSTGRRSTNCGGRCRCRPWGGGYRRRRRRTGSPGLTRRAGQARRQTDHCAFRGRLLGGSCATFALIAALATKACTRLECSAALRTGLRRHCAGVYQNKADGSERLPWGCLRAISTGASQYRRCAVKWGRSRSNSG